MSGFISQTEFIGTDLRETTLQILEEENAKIPFFVVGKAFRCLNLDHEIKKHYPQAVFFRDFAPNPAYESVVSGKTFFEKKHCDFIVAIGGGSAIDVAKCIKVFASMDDTASFLDQTITDNGVKLLAVPTTAGTGSEATHFSAIYDRGEKISVCHKRMLPEYVILNDTLLRFLPLYQKKVSMLDTLAHAIESIWSIHATEESVKYAAEAIRIFIKCYKTYLYAGEGNLLNMLCAANNAGKAINITKTTAAHAMAYKMTTMYGLPHGHSVALCLPRVWEYMSNHPEKCLDPHGKEALASKFKYISSLLGCQESMHAIAYLDDLIAGELEIDTPRLKSMDELKQLVEAVNPERLSNNPVMLDQEALEKIYRSLFHESKNII